MAEASRAVRQPGPVAIVGGGISGLSTAYYLAKAGIASTLFEPSPRLGGVIATEYQEGCVMELGPDSFISQKPAAAQLIRELGLGGELLGSNDHQRVTYIWKNGRMVALPDGLMMMVPTRIWPMAVSPLLSWPTKITMGLEYLRSAPREPLPDRSVAEFIRDHYGQETVDYLAEPLLSGVYGGDPEKLSVASVLTRFAELEAKYGSLTRGVLAERAKANGAGNGRAGGDSAAPASLFLTLKGGLGGLIEKLEQAIAGTTVVRRAKVEALERIADGYRLKADGGWMEARHVVFACPAWAVLPLVERVYPALVDPLRAVEYSSSLTLCLAYDRDRFDGRLEGFGFLVPRREATKMLACTMVGTKFSHRVPDHLVLLRCFFGGAGNESVLEEPDESLIAAARAELRRMIGLTAEPRFHRIARWPRSMAQYTVGHGARMKQLEEVLLQAPGLHLAGNAYTGIGVPDCIRMGKEAAGRIAGEAV